jgi:uncharacterized protein (TIGR02266 family)
LAGDAFLRERLLVVLRESAQVLWTPSHEHAWRAAFDLLAQSGDSQCARGCPEWPGKAPRLRSGRNPLAAAAEFLELCRRWRTGLPLAAIDLRRWQGLRRYLERILEGPGRAPRHSRRRWLRVPTRLHCAFRTDGEPVECLLTEVSEGGLFIETRQPLPVGTLLHLEIAGGLPGRPFTVDGTVVRSRRCATQREPAGMGVSFLALSPLQESAILQIVARALLLTLSAREPGDTDLGPASRRTRRE